MFDGDFLTGADSASVFNYLCALAKAYTPEWRDDRSRHDMGAVLARLYSRMFAENIARVNRLPEKISAQLVDALGTRPLPAHPARSVVRFSAVGARSVFLPRGTKLSATASDGGTLTFETLHSLTVVSAEISRIIFSHGGRGELYYSGGSNAVTLYGKMPGTVPAACMTIEHPYLLRLEAGKLLQIAFEGTAPEQLDALADPERFAWSFVTKTGTAVNACTVKSARGGHLTLTSAGAGPETDDAGEVVAVRCSAVKPVFGEMRAESLYIEASGENIAPEQIWQDDILQEGGRVYPFGKKLSLLNELKIACDSIFTQKGAEITMRFNLAYESFGYDLPAEQKRQYKLIMKAEAPVPPPVEVFAQEVVLECWNATGWRPLRTTPPATRIFAGEKAGEIELRFTCPGDIAPILLGAAERNWVRLRLLRADGCYMPNTIHCVPVISNIRLSYRYRQKSQRPSQVSLVREMREHNATEQLKSGSGISLFSPLSVDGERLMIGFAAKPAGDIINIYFDIEGTREPFWLEAEYSGASGFRKLHLDDYTDGFSHAEAVVFVAPEDFSAAEIYGESLCWVMFRLRPRDQNTVRELKIHGVYLNAVAVEGKRTGEAEIFYTDELITKNELRLAHKALLYTEVWVDENANLSHSEKARLREEMPGGIREEQDSAGNPLSFWVRWEETVDFISAGAKGRFYRLDRSSGTVIFSDGAHARRPYTGESAAIRVVPVSSEGARGNIPKHAITQPLEQLDFIGGVDNIAAACGGYDAQTPDTLLRHVCSRVRSGGRIVTAEDMLDAVRFSCGEIAKLKLICECGVITLLFLPYDYENTPQLYSQIKEHIRAVLARSWRDPPSGVRILPPDFAELLIEAGVASSGDALNEEEAVRRRLDEFLHPITGGFGRIGWEIGTLPQRDQILSVMQSACPKARVEQLRISVRNRTSGQYISLQDAAFTQSLAVICGKYNFKWRRMLHA